MTCRIGVAEPLEDRHAVWEQRDQSSEKTVWSLVKQTDEIAPSKAPARNGTP